jgi:hypothetical protein
MHNLNMADVMNDVRLSESPIFLYVRTHGHSTVQKLYNCLYIMPWIRFVFAEDMIRILFEVLDAEWLATRRPATAKSRAARELA